MKKAAALIVTLLIGLSLLVGTSYSWLFSTDEKTNNLQIADMTVKIDEEFDPPQEPEGGKTYAKAVQIQNTTNAPAFIRVEAFPELVKNDGNTYPADALVTFTVNEEHWKDGGDGYYYYLHALAPGETTESLFTEAALNEQLAEPDYAGTQVQLTVRSEACGITRLTDGTYGHVYAWWHGEAPTADPLLSIHTTLVREGGLS